jgi:hypothetical protein
MRKLLVLLFLGTAGIGQEPVQPDPGRIPTDIVEVGPLRVRPKAGNAKVALQTWIEAHALHKEGKLPEALGKYVLFLGMPGHLALPQRYSRSARNRVDAIHNDVRKEFEASLKLYPTQRAKAVDMWKLLAGRWLVLPEGYAAKQLWHSDELRGAIDAAKKLKGTDQAKSAATALEKSIRAYAMGLYLYEARTLLVELGGPDLRPKPKIDVGEDAPEEEPGKEDDDSVIEVND